MRPKPFEERLKAEIKLISKIYPLGWIPKGNWRFEKNNILYDLSGADTKQLERIEKEKLFVVEGL